MTRAKQVADILDAMTRRAMDNNRLVIESLSLGGMAKIDFVDGELVVTRITGEQLRSAALDELVKLDEDLMAAEKK